MGPALGLVALLAVLVAGALFIFVYWFVASIAIAALARLFAAPETVSQLFLGAVSPAFDRALIRTLSWLGLAR